MTAPRHKGSVRPRALAAYWPAPRRPDHSSGHRTPESRGKPRPPTRAEPLEPRTLLAILVVTTDADAGPGSLRQAILDANATTAADGIRFAIPTAPATVPTIRLLSALPVLSTPIAISAIESPTTRTPRINLDGSAAGPGVDGLVLRAFTCSLYGLAVYGFSGNGVVLERYPNQVGLCHIGLTADGTPAGNGAAGVLVSSEGGRVGAFGPIEQPLPNVISANAGPGVRVAAPLQEANRPILVHGNLIGTDPAGRLAVPNGGGGVVVDVASECYVSGNLISGNAGAGVRVGAEGLTSMGGNRIGVNVDGTLPLGNGGPGIAVVGNTALATISNNRIAHNAGLGIDLGADGVTPNDPLDRDAGPNGRQNFPVITRVSESGGQVAITVRLHSTPHQPVRIELFRSARPDPTGHGEGERFVTFTQITPNPASDVEAVITVPRTSLPAASWLSATATDEWTGTTSEFSAAVSALGGRPVFRPATPTRDVVAASPATILGKDPPRRGVPPPRGLLT